MARKSSHTNQVMRLPDGLILQLRNTARMLMAALYWAQKCKSDPKVDLAEESNGARLQKVRQGFTAWPVDVNQMLGFKRVALPDDMPSIDGKDSPAMPELKPICNILRRQTSFGIRLTREGDEIRDYDEYDEADLAALKEALSLPVTSVWQGPVDHACYRPWYLLVNGPPLRILADMLMDYTFMLVSDYGITGKRPVFGLHEHNPIAICRHCEGLFLRTRADGEFCSKKCGAAHWRGQNKQHLSKYQAKWRTELKAETRRISQKQSKSATRKRK